MKKHFIPLGLCCALFASCATTGDPTTGGIFWSPTKAQARQYALLSEHSAMQSELDSENAKTRSLIAQRERLRAQIEKKKAELRNAASLAEAATLNHEINDLMHQLSAL